MRKGKFRGLGSGEQYLRDYPALERWMNQCILCQARGYKPELPEMIGKEPTFADQNLRSFFKPLPVDALGRCEVCASAADSARR
jgi:hypothetical protein